VTGFHNQRCYFQAGHKRCTVSHCNRRGSAKNHAEQSGSGWGLCKLWWSTGLGKCHWCLRMSNHYPQGCMG
jgi:hypothetical protein